MKFAMLGLIYIALVGLLVAVGMGLTAKVVWALGELIK